MQAWGDGLICEDCLAEEAPEFNEEENSEDTSEAYNALKEKYCGKRALDKYRDDTVELTWGREVDYSINVTFDKDGYISDISTIDAQKLISETERYSDYRPYPVCNEDYLIAAGMIEDMLGN